MFLLKLKSSRLTPKSSIKKRWVMSLSSLISISFRLKTKSMSRILMKEIKNFLLWNWTPEKLFKLWTAWRKNFKMLSKRKLISRKRLTSNKRSNSKPWRILIEPRKTSMMLSLTIESRSNLLQKLLAWLIHSNLWNRRFSTRSLKTVSRTGREKLKSQKLLQRKPEMSLDNQVATLTLWTCSMTNMKCDCNMLLYNCYSIVC